jgi:hypothetical protein
MPDTALRLTYCETCCEEAKQVYFTALHLVAKAQELGQ